MRTIWVFGDQLNRDIGALRSADASSDRILMVESTAKFASKRWHRQRAHFVLASMRRFAGELEAAGFEVDLRTAPTMADGFRQHVEQFSPDTVVATEPASWDAHRLLERCDVEMVRSNQFLCHYDEFADWADTRKHLKMEDFYRWHRARLGYLMDGDEPVTGRWNYDDENRQPPPRGDAPWPAPPVSRLDDLDHRVLADLDDPDVFGAHCWGAAPDGTWATSRRAALTRLRHFVEHSLPVFGPHEDAMTTRSWHLAHSVLSPYLNVGLLLPGEVCEAVHDAYEAGHVPIASAEGYIRQVIGWREYVWGVYWRWMPDYRSANELGATRPLPPVFTGAATEMRCMSECLSGVHDRAYAHHIQRLMVLGNLALLTGVDPWAMTDWMWSSFIDGAEWVMLPNVVGMSLHADGGRMATKPYAAGGNYIDKMSDYCADCRFDRKARVGDDACPFTTLYWDFLARHHEQFVRNPRMARQVRAAERLSDLDDVRARAADVLERLDRGDL